ncbi:hypothetical protein EXW59_28045 [Bacillus mycoides]|nr:hypothetical protein EXW59_28045 [Bacillus mycoides]QWI46827.1 hypothetical protein EXW55_21540 [Bacillus mycoides]
MYYYHINLSSNLSLLFPLVALFCLMLRLCLRLFLRIVL